MFELEQFVSDCRMALKQDASHKFVHDVVAQAVSHPADVLRALGEPKRGEMQTLYRAGDLTIHRIIEQETAFLPALDMLPSLTPELLDENRAWMRQAKALDEAD